MKVFGMQHEGSFRAEQKWKSIYMELHLYDMPTLMRNLFDTESFSASNA
jgi:hypothetical protein